MPIKDSEAYREYMRNYMRENSPRKSFRTKTREEILERLVFLQLYRGKRGVAAYVDIEIKTLKWVLKIDDKLKEGSETLYKVSDLK